MSYSVPQPVAWDPSKATDLASYNVYWAIPPAVLDKVNPKANTNVYNIGNVTQISLPTAVPGFPQVDGTVEFGVAAVDTVGNISDIKSALLPFNLLPPDPPGVPHFV